MDARNSQNFVQIPFASLVRMSYYLAEENGITVIEQEESYTSKASFPDRDMIPVWHKEGDIQKENQTFSKMPGQPRTV
ncbi:MAG: hypothetical protein ACOX6J_00430 [Oscillospiraceae bacterium]|jgi:putative transposase